MPCLSSSADSVLNESIRVSNAESQLAVPLTMTTVFGVQRDFLAERIGGLHRRGSRRRCRRGLRGGGRSCGRGRRAGGRSRGWPPAPGAARRAGVAGVLAAGGARGAGDCASAMAEAQRNRGCRDQRDHGEAERAEAIHSVFSMAVSARRALALACPGSRRRSAPTMSNTQGPLSSHDRYVMGAPLPAGARHRFTTLANPPSFAI